MVCFNWKQGSSIKVELGTNICYLTGGGVWDSSDHIPVGMGSGRRKVLCQVYSNTYSRFSIGYTYNTSRYSKRWIRTTKWFENRSLGYGDNQHGFGDSTVKTFSEFNEGVLDFLSKIKEKKVGQGTEANISNIRKSKEQEIKRMDTLGKDTMTVQMVLMKKR